MRDAGVILAAWCVDRRASAAEGAGGGVGLYNGMNLEALGNMTGQQGGHVLVPVLHLLPSSIHKHLGWRGVRHAPPSVR